MNKENLTKVIWNDAISYYNIDEMPNKLTKKETVGELVKEEKGFILLKNPKTKDYNPYSHRGVVEKNQDPTFLFVPRGMIVNTEKI
jgi:hypothetical protein